MREETISDAINDLDSISCMIQDIHESICQDSPDYWTRLEHQAAIAAMQGFISSKRGLNIETDMYDIPYYSQMLAHALVEKMKEERK